MKPSINDFIKVNKRPLSVKTNKKGMYFIFKKVRYYLDDFIRTHNNPWLADIYPDNIIAVNTSNYNSYCDPLFIEIIDTFDILVNVYERR